MAEFKIAFAAIFIFFCLFQDGRAQFEEDRQIEKRFRNWESSRVRRPSRKIDSVSFVGGISRTASQDSRVGSRQAIQDRNVLDSYAKNRHGIIDASRDETPDNGQAPRNGKFASAGSRSRNEDHGRRANPSRISRRIDRDDSDDGKRSWKMDGGKFTSGRTQRRGNGITERNIGLGTEGKEDDDDGSTRRDATDAKIVRKPIGPNRGRVHYTERPHVSSPGTVTRGRTRGQGRAVTSRYENSETTDATISFARRNDANLFPRQRQNLANDYDQGSTGESHDSGFSTGSNVEQFFSVATRQPTTATNRVQRGRNVRNRNSETVTGFATSNRPSFEETGSESPIQSRHQVPRKIIKQFARRRTDYASRPSSVSPLPSPPQQHFATDVTRHLAQTRIDYTSTENAKHTSESSLSSLHLGHQTASPDYTKYQTETPAGWTLSRRRHVEPDPLTPFVIKSRRGSQTESNRANESPQEIDRPLTQGEIVRSDNRRRRKSEPRVIRRSRLSTAPSADGETTPAFGTGSRTDAETSWNGENVTQRSDRTRDGSRSRKGNSGNVRTTEINGLNAADVSFRSNLRKRTTQLPAGPTAKSVAKAKALRIDSGEIDDDSANYPKEFLERVKSSTALPGLAGKTTGRSDDVRKEATFGTGSLTTPSPIATTLSESWSTKEKIVHLEKPGKTEMEEEVASRTVSPRRRYSQSFYRKLAAKRSEKSPSEKSSKPATTAFATTGKESPTTEKISGGEERRKFVPKSKISPEARRQRIDSLTETAGKRSVFPAEPKPDESLIFQASTYPEKGENLTTVPTGTASPVMPTSATPHDGKKQHATHSPIPQAEPGVSYNATHGHDLLTLGTEDNVHVVYATRDETTERAATEPETDPTAAESATLDPVTTTSANETESTTARKTDFAVLNVTLFPSTRHRFSSKINSTDDSPATHDVETVTLGFDPIASTNFEQQSPQETSTVPSARSLFNSSLTASVTTEKTTGNSIVSSTESLSSAAPITTAAATPETSTPSATTKRSRGKKKSSKRKASGKRSKAKSPVNNNDNNSAATEKSDRGSGDSKTAKNETITVRTAEVTSSGKANVQPLPLAFSGFINETIKVVNSNPMTSPVPGIVPRSELNAFTPETRSEKVTPRPETKSTGNGNSNGNSTDPMASLRSLPETLCVGGSCEKSKSQYLYLDGNREPLPYARSTGTTKSPEDLRKIFIFGLFPNNTVQRRPFSKANWENGNRVRQSSQLEFQRNSHDSRGPSSTSPAPYTAGDYYVFGIYPNNSVVRRRGWKTFDHEKYNSPYVIFGIYPNNTIVKKYPNGTTINDEFAISDNEIRKMASEGKLHDRGCSCANNNKNGFATPSPTESPRDAARSTDSAVSAKPRPDETERVKGSATNEQEDVDFNRISGGREKENGEEGRVEESTATTEGNRPTDNEVEDEESDEEDDDSNEGEDEGSDEEEEGNDVGSATATSSPYDDGATENNGSGGSLNEIEPGGDSSTRRQDGEEKATEEPEEEDDSDGEVTTSRGSNESTTPSFDSGKGGVGGLEEAEENDGRSLSTTPKNANEQLDSLDDAENIDDANINESTESAEDSRTEGSNGEKAIDGQAEETTTDEDRPEETATDTSGVKKAYEIDVRFGGFGEATTEATSEATTEATTQANAYTEGDKTEDSPNPDETSTEKFGRIEDKTTDEFEWPYGTTKNTNEYEKTTERDEDEKQILLETRGNFGEQTTEVNKREEQTTTEMSGYGEEKTTERNDGEEQGYVETRGSIGEQTTEVNKRGEQTTAEMSGYGEEKTTERNDGQGYAETRGKEEESSTERNNDGKEGISDSEGYAEEDSTEKSEDESQILLETRGNFGERTTEANERGEQTTAETSGYGEEKSTERNDPENQGYVETRGKEEERSTDRNNDKGQGISESEGYAEDESTEKNEDEAQILLETRGNFGPQTTETSIYDERRTTERSTEVDDESTEKQGRMDKKTTEEFENFYRVITESNGFGSERNLENEVEKTTETNEDKELVRNRFLDANELAVGGTTERNENEYPETAREYEEQKTTERSTEVDDESTEKQEKLDKKTTEEFENFYRVITESNGFGSERNSENEVEKTTETDGNKELVRNRFLDANESAVGGTTERNENEYPEYKEQKTTERSTEVDDESTEKQGRMDKKTTEEFENFYSVITESNGFGSERNLENEIEKTTEINDNKELVGNRFLHANEYANERFTERNEYEGEKTTRESENGEKTTTERIEGEGEKITEAYDYAGDRRKEGGEYEELRTTARGEQIGARTGNDGDRNGNESTRKTTAKSDATETESLSPANNRDFRYDINDFLGGNGNFGPTEPYNRYGTEETVRTVQKPVKTDESFSIDLGFGLDEAEGSSEETATESTAATATASSYGSEGPGYYYDRPTGRPFADGEVYSLGYEVNSLEGGNRKGSQFNREPAGFDSKGSTFDTDPTDIDVRVLGADSPTFETGSEATQPTTADSHGSETMTSKTRANILLLHPSAQEPSTENTVRKRQRKSTFEETDEPSSLTNLAYRALSFPSENSEIPILTTTTTTTTFASPTLSTVSAKKNTYPDLSRTSVKAFESLTKLTSAPLPFDEVFVVTPVPKTNDESKETKRGKVKFVTLTPGYVVTTNIEKENEILNLSTKHVQKVTKAPAVIPENFLTTLFGQIEGENSSPGPETLRNYGKDLEADIRGGRINLPLARRIVALALENGIASTDRGKVEGSKSSPDIENTTKVAGAKQSTPTTANDKRTATTRKPTAKPSNPTPKKVKPAKATTPDPAVTTRDETVIITPKKQYSLKHSTGSPSRTNGKLTVSSDDQTAKRKPSLEHVPEIDPLEMALDPKERETSKTKTGGEKVDGRVDSILAELWQGSTTTTTTKGPMPKITIAKTNDEIHSTKKSSDSLSAADLDLLQAILSRRGNTKANRELERIVENQIRLAEEVRKASRNLKRKQQKTISTTQKPPPPPKGLTFLFNLLGSGGESNFSDSNVPKRSKKPFPESQESAKNNTPDPIDEPDDGFVTGERTARGELVSAAIDVTKAVSKFMGTVLSNAAQGFQGLFKNFAS